MAKCDITIDVPPGPHTPGETVQGTVTVTVDQNCRCDDLKIELQWFTHGKGNRSNKAIDTRSLFQGEWKAGEVHTFGFNFTVPDRPFTYHGHFINVEHRLVATADIPWAIDPKEEVPFPIAPPQFGRYVAEWDEKVLHPETSGGCLACSCVALLLGGGLLGAALADGSEGIAQLGGGIAFFAAFAFLGMLRKFLAERRTGRVKIELRHHGQQGYREAQALDQLHCAVLTKANANVHAITATLEVHEQAVSGSGSNKTTHRHQLHKRVFVLEPRGDGRHETMIQMPYQEQMPPSFDLPSNAIVWKLGFHVEIQGWPDYEHVVPLTLLGEASRR